MNPLKSFGFVLVVLSICFMRSNAGNGIPISAKFIADLGEVALPELKNPINFEAFKRNAFLIKLLIKESVKTLRDKDLAEIKTSLNLEGVELEKYINRKIIAYFPLIDDNNRKTELNGFVNRFTTVQNGLFSYHYPGTDLLHMIRFMMSNKDQAGDLRADGYWALAAVYCWEWHLGKPWVQK